MHRPHTFYSPLGVILSIFFLLALALTVWFTGGLAFSPGRLSGLSHASAGIGEFSSHADFEGECQRCHQPGGTLQSQLCMTCHKNVLEEMTSQTGIHARLSAGGSCAACHPDHRGRGFDSAAAAWPFFDHSQAQFSLIRHSLDYDLSPLACQKCHVAGSPGFPVDSQSCSACHGNHDSAFMAGHMAALGPDCQGCHDGLDSLAHFDHCQTRFPLDGRHLGLTCLDCHSTKFSSLPAGNPNFMDWSVPLVAGLIPPAPPSTLSATATAAGIDSPGLAIARFSGLSPACQSCHTEPEIHRGLFPPDCANCHNTTGWMPANLYGAPFSHQSIPKFTLERHSQDYRGSPLACTACHQPGISPVDPNTCVACHSDHDRAFMQAHLAQAGPNCLECHDGRDRMAGFDHSAFFPLDGKHAGLSCRECHLEGFENSAASECVQCHTEPPIHAGFFGLECQSCHTDSAWSPAYLHAHTFPLDHGGGGQLACQICHTAAYDEYTCYGCHEHQPVETADKHQEEGISLAELITCAACHPDGREAQNHD